MRGQARSSVNTRTGVEVATRQLLRVCKGGFFVLKNEKEMYILSFHTHSISPL
jgi:hypothetical protein